MTVLAANRWPTNAHLIEDCARLGYLSPELNTIDPTYGKGGWWTRWRPRTLVTHDIRLDGVDFRNLPHKDGSFSQAVFDPPYVCIGGRQTTGIPEMHDRYGMTDAPRTPRGVQDLINAGLDELARVVEPGGIVLAKCQDYITSGRLWPGTHNTLIHAMAAGFDLWDRLEHISNPRPQPSGRAQKHARRNLSTLLVLRRQP